MVNALYDLGRESFLRGEIAWQTDDIREILVDLADYTPSLSGHQFLSSVPSIARVAVSASLTSKTTSLGVADAADPVFPGATGDQSEAIIGYKHTGSDATARLIYYIDSATGLPVTPNTGDINHVFSNGADRIFRL